VKTDKRDALALARLLRTGDLTPVWIPYQEEEALRDLLRLHFDAKEDLLRVRHRLSKFLLRQGLYPPPGVKA
jgi:transposase